jgi:TolA-binding protein
MRRVLTITLVSLAVAVSSCGKKEDGAMPKVNGIESEKKNEIDKNASDNLKNPDEEHEKFNTEMQKQINEIDQQIQVLKLRLETATGKVKDKLEHGLHEIEEERQEVQQKFDALKAETAEKWQALKEKTQGAIAHLKEKIERVKKDIE